MHVFEVVTALLLGGALLALLARQLGTPYPALVALAGAVLALVPGTPTLILDPELALALFVAPVLLDAAVLARILWVTAAAAFSRWRPRATAPSDATNPVAVSPSAAALVGWCGMRGIVTLATALALPTGADGLVAFPYRDLILFTAFAVVLVTLVVQGLTLRPVMMRLH